MKDKSERGEAWERPGSTADGKAETEERGKHVMDGVGDRGEGCVYNADGARNAIHIGDTSVAADDNRPTRICRGPSQLERGRGGRHGLA